MCGVVGDTGSYGPIDRLYHSFQSKYPHKTRHVLTASAVTVPFRAKAVSKKTPQFKTSTPVGTSFSSI
jgi:hypothetical protein